MIAATKSLYVSKMLDVYSGPIYNYIPLDGLSEFALSVYIIHGCFFNLINLILIYKFKRTLLLNGVYTLIGCDNWL